ncbi:MAG: ABC transporter permease [Rhodocyclaceae bacterium]|nr:ABC transporter permease [Rhodocyclaceae bacterium]
MLGMIIGVGAVVLMLAIGSGASERVRESIDALGSDLFIVLSGAPSLGGLRYAAGSTPTLDVEDAAAIDQLASVQATAPTHWGSAQLQFRGANWPTSVYGSTAAFPQVRHWSLAAGTSIDAADVRGARRVVVLGATVASELFGTTSPVGQTLRINGQPFEVRGVFREKGQSLSGRDQDDLVFVPLSTAQRQLFGSPFPGAVRFISVKAQPGQLASAMRDTTALLRQRHRLSGSDESDFAVRDLTARNEAAAESARTMRLLLGAIASVSLLVGGIGIMNIMLVSVTERTREIGIRMAVGARRRDILGQFLLETLLICLIGGALGVSLGVGGAWLAATLFDMPVVVSLGAVLLAFVFAAAVGVFFGFYPARKAAGLPPAEALRAV